MEKTNQKHVCRITRRSAAFFLAILMMLAALPVSSGGAEGECEHRYKRSTISNVQGWVWESYITYEFIDDYEHREYCTNCGKDFGKHDHNFAYIVDGFDNTAHYFYCYTCRHAFARPHHFNRDGICEVCRYQNENVPSSSGDTGGTNQETGTEESSGSGTQPSESRTDTNQEKQSDKNSGSGKGFVLPQKADKNAYECSCVINGEEQTVLIQIFGLCRCYVFIDGVPTYVFTSDLKLADGVAQDQMLVYIKAGSHARLYRDTDFKKSIALCDPGMILPVLSVGEKYIEVQYNGKTGYLKRSSCQLCAPVKGLGIGMIDNGKQSVNIRQEASTKSTKITSVKPGTEITILSENGNWYEVEYFGLHGYTRKEFVEWKEKGFGEQPASDDGCPEDGRHIGAPENEKYLDNDHHQWTCSNCGETVTEEHGMIDYSITPVQYENSTEHSYTCNVCRGKVYQGHDFGEDGICTHCGYGKTYSAGETVKNGVNLREKASRNSDLLHTLKKGERAEILSEQTGKDGRTWYYCRVDGKTGYIRSDMLKIVEKDIQREIADETPRADEQQEENPPEFTATDENTEDLPLKEVPDEGTAGQILFAEEDYYEMGGQDGETPVIPVDMYVSSWVYHAGEPITFGADLLGGTPPFRVHWNVGESQIREYGTPLDQYYKAHPDDKGFTADSTTSDRHLEFTYTPPVVSETLYAILTVIDANGNSTFTIDDSVIWAYPPYDWEKMNGAADCLNDEGFPLQGWITEDHVPMTAGLGEADTEFAQLDRDTIVKALWKGYDAAGKKWYYVRSDLRTRGYVCSDYICFESPDRRGTQTDTAFETGEDSQVLNPYSGEEQNKTVSETGEDRPASNRDLQESQNETASTTEEIRQAVTIDETMVRETPNKDGTLIRAVDTDTEVSVLKEIPDENGLIWYQIRLQDGTDGYARSNFFEMKEETDEDWKKAYYEYLIGGGFLHRKAPKEDSSWTYWTDRFGVEYCMDAVDGDGVLNSARFALYDWDQDGVPELLSYDGSSFREGCFHAYTFRNGEMKYIGKIGTGNSGLAPYRDETRNVLFSALIDGYSTEVFYAIVDNDLSAKPETLFGAQYIDKGDDQPGEWKVTDGPADQELYDLFRASYGDEPDFDSCRIHFYDAVENMDDYWWNTFIHTY